MKRLDKLLSNNRRWAANIRSHEPDFFTRLSQLQVPEYLWMELDSSGYGDSVRAADIDCLDDRTRVRLVSQYWQTGLR